MQQKMPWISPTRLHALFLARARYCITPHRNFDGPCQCCRCCQSARLGGRGDGARRQDDGRLALGAWVSRWPSSESGSWVVPWLHGCTPSPCAWVWFRSQSLGLGARTVHPSTIPSPRLDPDERVLSWSLLKKSQWGKETHKEGNEEGEGRKEGRREREES